MQEFDYLLSEIDPTIAQLERMDKMVDASLIVDLIKTINNTFYNACISTYIYSIKTSIDNKSDSFKSMKSFITKYENISVDTADQETYSNFLDDLEKYSLENPSNLFSNKTLYEFYIEDLYNQYFLEYEKQFKHRINRFMKLLQRYKSKHQVLMDTNFISLDPYEFEEYIGELFKSMGYSVVITRKSGDFGVDVLAKNAVETIGIQVKKYSEDNKVGNVEVQKLLGSLQFKDYNADRGILITTSSFTKQAIEQASGTPIELWDNVALKNKIVLYFLK